MSLHRPVRFTGAAIGRRLTYANVTSTMALVVALGTGSAYAANTIGSSDIIDGEVRTADLADSAVTSAKINDGAVKTADLGANSVGTLKVGDESLGAADLGPDSVGSAELATDSVQATEVADDAIDSGEIVDESLFAADLAGGSVGTSEVADGALTGADVANNSLTTADLKGADVNGGHISIGAGAVANGRCRQFNSGIGGAATGEAVLYSVQAAVQDGVLIYGSRVSAPGTVTLNVCNFSGTTLAAITDLPVRVITFGS